MYESILLWIEERINEADKIFLRNQIRGNIGSHCGARSRVGIGLPFYLER